MKTGKNPILQREEVSNRMIRFDFPTRLAVILGSPPAEKWGVGLLARWGMGAVTVTNPLRTLAMKGEDSLRESWKKKESREGYSFFFFLIA